MDPPSAFPAGFNEKYVPSFLSQMLDGVLFNNLKAIENIPAPVAIVHRFADDVIDISSAELLHSKIPRGFRRSRSQLPRQASRSSQPTGTRR
jgi:hypothetical protein